MYLEAHTWEERRRLREEIFAARAATADSKSFDKLLLALKTASDLVREKLLSCVSSRVADSLREELAVMGPVRVKDVEDAQKRIVEVALQLQKEGKLLIAGAQGDDFV